MRRKFCQKPKVVFSLLERSIFVLGFYETKVRFLSNEEKKKNISRVVSIKQIWTRSFFF